MTTQQHPSTLSFCGETRKLGIMSMRYRRTSSGIPLRADSFHKHQVFKPIGQFYGWAEHHLTTDGTVAELVYPSELPANKEMCHGAMRLTFSEDGTIEVEWREEGGQYWRAPAICISRDRVGGIVRGVCSRWNLGLPKYKVGLDHWTLVTRRQQSCTSRGLKTFRGSDAESRRLE